MRNEKKAKVKSRDFWKLGVSDELRCHKECHKGGGFVSNHGCMLRCLNETSNGRGREDDLHMDVQRWVTKQLLLTRGCNRMSSRSTDIPCACCRTVA